jgi:hypothetical protein
MADSHSTLIRGCTKCGISKPLTEFHRAKRGLYGHQAFCKECAKLMARKRYEEKGEEINAKTLAKYHARQEPIRQEKAKQKESFLALPIKRCAKCKQDKDKYLFGKAKERPDGLKPYCRECSAMTSKESRNRNIESSRQSSRRYYSKNIESKRLYSKYWRMHNVERQTENARLWRHRNIERVRELNRIRKRRIDVRIRSTMSNRIRLALKNGKARASTFSIVGYSFLQLKHHLEMQFLGGMSWDNYGEWHIDHIVPLSSFNIDSFECADFKAAWGLPNLRPLWAKDNLKKSYKKYHLL